MLKKIAHIGIYPELSFKEQTKIRIFNTSCIVISVINVFYSFLSFFQEQYLVVFLSVLEFFLVIFGIWLNHIRRHTLSFHIGIMQGILFVFVISMIFGQTNHSHIFFLFMPIASLILFDNRKVILFYFLLAMVFLMGTKIMFSYYKPYYTEIPMSELIGVMNLFFTGLLIFIGVRQFKNENAEFIGKIDFQRKVIEEKNKDITDSINYAKKIQQAILPATDMIFKTLTDSFIFYKPKDIVSGDFYFFAQKDDTVLIGACDCTGHGVPGAFMSMIGHEQLNKIVIEKGITEPAKILTELNIGVKNILKQSGGDDESRDGMDISLVSLQYSKSNLQNEDYCKMEYAGANRPLFLFRKNILEEVKADKTALGGLTPNNFIFHQHSFDFKKGDAVYIFTDGFADQFGRNGGKKFTTKKFKELLISVSHFPMKEQENILAETIEKWMGDAEQVDDILVIGVKI